MSTSLLKGVPTLTAPHTVCKEGETLNPNQVNLLKLFGKTYATVSRHFPGSQAARHRVRVSCSVVETGGFPAIFGPYARILNSVSLLQFQIVPLLGIHLTDGSICGGSEEATAAAMADDDEE